MDCALIAAFTFGSMNQKELTFTDNFLIASYRQMAYGIAGGAVFNLANNRLGRIPRHREIKPSLVRTICKQLDVPYPSER